MTVLFFRYTTLYDIHGRQIIVCVCVSCINKCYVCILRYAEDLKCFQLSIDNRYVVALE